MVGLIVVSFVLVSGLIVLAMVFRSSVDAVRVSIHELVAGATAMTDAAARLTAPVVPVESPEHEDLMRRLAAVAAPFPPVDSFDSFEAEWAQWGDPRVGGLTPGEPLVEGLAREDT